MIGHLEGVLREKGPTRVLIGVGGVGYEVLVSLSTFAALPDEGKTVALRIHTHVREDAIQLFGFHTDLERGLFEQLIRTSGVGPKLAQGVLSGLPPMELLAALRDGDVAALRAVPGIGTKTAQRLLVDLRDRVPELVALAGERAAELPSTPAVEDEPLEEVISALVNLGTPRARAARAAREAAHELGEEVAIEVLIRAALRGMAG